MATTPTTSAPIATYTPVTYTDVKTSSVTGGTNSYEITLNLLFWNEMQALANGMSPPEFDGGYIQEVLGGGKFKVKLNGLGSVVTATGGNNAHKGWYALILCTPSDRMSPNATYSYSIVAQRQINVETSTPSEYSV